MKNMILDVVYCFKIDLLRQQPCWFSLYRWRAGEEEEKKEREKLALWRKWHFCQACQSCSWRHRHRISNTKAAAPAVVFSRVSNIGFLTHHAVNHLLLWVYSVLHFHFAVTRDVFHLYLQGPVGTTGVSVPIFIPRAARTHTLNWSSAGLIRR